MSSSVLTERFAAPPVNRGEILRYAGVKGGAHEFAKILDSCIDEAVGKLDYRVCYAEFSVCVSNGVADLGFAVTSSEVIRKYMAECEKVILFAATVGIGADRLVSRYASVSPSRSLMLQAVCTERIESLCDAFCDEYSKKAEKDGLFLKPRISPGYGDIPLSMQKEIFAALDCGRRIGLTLNESLVMSPTKSVTAIIGVGRKKENGENTGGFYEAYRLY